MCIRDRELTGIPSPVPGLKESKFHHYGVKEAVFPFNMFQEVDPILGPVSYTHLDCPPRFGNKASGLSFSMI